MTERATTGNELAFGFDCKSRSYCQKLAESWRRFGSILSRRRGRRTVGEQAPLHHFAGTATGDALLISVSASSRRLVARTSSSPVFRRTVIKRSVRTVGRLASWTSFNCSRCGTSYTITLRPSWFSLKSGSRSQRCWPDSGRQTGDPNAQSEPRACTRRILDPKAPGPKVPNA